MNTTIQTGLALLTAFALKVMGAIVIWFVGRWLIRLGLKLPITRVSITIGAWLRARRRRATKGHLFLCNAVPLRSKARI